ncbi:MAG: phosphate--AMP phosphotransferase, partial [Anaerolineae bacterium]
MARFQKRSVTEYKSWKLTDEDWRNRAKWDAYKESVEDMLLRTSTVTAPWTVVEGNDKRWARIRALKTLVDLVSSELDYKPADVVKK